MYQSLDTGAIMFGDELTHSECVALVRTVSSCALPFQCAHGNVPLSQIIFVITTFFSNLPYVQADQVWFHC